MERTEIPPKITYAGDNEGLRWQWLAAIGIAVAYALVTNVPHVAMALTAGSPPLHKALIQTAGTVGFAFIAAGAALDFGVGLVESFRSGMKNDHD